MYKIGLTGGIGCGKSTISDLFKQLAIAVIDADEIAHALVAPGQKALIQISTHFGSQFINSDNSLNRSLLRDCVFQDPKKRRQLENILHPLVYAEINQQLSQLNSPYAIISIPLLIETRMQSLVDHILVIDCPMEIQVNRVKLRDRLSDSQITAIINSQVSRTERLTNADSIIDTTQGLSSLSQQVNTLHQQFLKQAQ
ncbi:MAG: dephospho-CoA kinase [Gammaproteobacteria bacterium]|jgi:dephospho-CoA kinase|nr:dephospho-CoA kinase [Gammaproteobacteria bacterium]MBT4147358.1 dephospho-CoA kinase [Gammaproteobacteria bacterium]MBT5222538.1 dephospho-CoA kinase [Gammaproteobacteria bacterium]MBT5825316.1 dephospho-CoA kinase [Gammaproteobacteria bacterium]MBT6420933.1 dephospho-CoA kinase [Gammaproteobacteria bacterium]